MTKYRIRVDEDGVVSIGAYFMGTQGQHRVTAVKKGGSDLPELAITSMEAIATMHDKVNRYNQGGTSELKEGK